MTPVRATSEDHAAHEKRPKEEPAMSRYVDALMDDGTWERAEVVRAERLLSHETGRLLLRLVRDGLEWWAEPEEWRDAR